MMSQLSLYRIGCFSQPRGSCAVVVPGQGVDRMIASQAAALADRMGSGAMRIIPCCRLTFLSASAGGSDAMHVPDASQGDVLAMHLMVACGGGWLSVAALRS